MPIVLLDHARINVAEVLGHDQQRCATHDSMTGIGMPQRVEIGGGLDPSPRACFGHRAGLIRFPPTVPIRLPQHQLHTALGGCKSSEELDRFVVQHDVTTTTGLARADVQGARIRIKVANLQ